MSDLPGTVETQPSPSEAIDSKVQKAYDGALEYITVARKAWPTINVGHEEEGAGAETVKNKLRRLQTYAVKNQGENSLGGLDEWKNLGEPQSLPDDDNNFNVKKVYVWYSAKEHRLIIAHEKRVEDAARKFAVPVPDVEGDIKNVLDAPKPEWFLKGDQIASKLLTLATTRPLKPHQLLL